MENVKKAKDRLAHIGEISTRRDQNEEIDERILR